MIESLSVEDLKLENHDLKKIIKRKDKEIRKLTGELKKL